MGRMGLWGSALVLSMTWTGCMRSQPTTTAAKPPEVVVSRPVMQEVTDYEDFTGRSEAIPSIDIRARVSGYLDSVPFKDKHKEGAEVEEGEPLFEIDPRIYQADYDRAEANVHQAKAHLQRLQLDYNRGLPLLPSKAISQEDFDKIAGDRDEAAAAVHVAEAQRDLAALNLKFTHVAAPISGRISRPLIDPGNMVVADNTILTTIVSLDPIYVYFDVDERTTLQVRRLIREGKIKSSREAPLPVFAGLVDEVDDKGNPKFPHEGVIDFVDNRVDAMAGTLRIRGKFPNKERIFSPGMFVRLRVPIGAPRSAVCISEQALGTNQGQPFVDVVNDNNEVKERRVTLGQLHKGLRVVEEGLGPDEVIIVEGLQRVKEGDKVKPNVVEMPLPGAPVAPPAAPAEKKETKK